MEDSLLQIDEIITITKNLTIFTMKILVRKM